MKINKHKIAVRGMDYAKSRINSGYVEWDSAHKQSATECSSEIKSSTSNILSAVELILHPFDLNFDFDHVPLGIESDGL